MVPIDYLCLSCIHWWEKKFFFLLMSMIWHNKTNPILMGITWPEYFKLTVMESNHCYEWFWSFTMVDVSCSNHSRIESVQWSKFHDSIGKSKNFIVINVFTLRTFTFKIYAINILEWWKYFCSRIHSYLWK